MLTRIAAVLAMGALCSCSGKSAPTEQTYVDPITGSKTSVSVATLGGVQVVALREKPEGFGTLSINSKPVVGYVCSPDESCDISVFIGKAPRVTVKTRSQGEALKEVQVFGSNWATWDHNGDGQTDTRVRNQSKVVEIWLDNQWMLRTSAGTGTERKYLVGGREVELSEKGWVYRGT